MDYLANAVRQLSTTQPERPQTSPPPGAGLTHRTGWVERRAPEVDSGQELSSMRNARLAEMLSGESDGKVVFVDSGIGGAMTTNLIRANTTEVGHTDCLPIGEQAPPQRISYTAHMVVRGLVEEGANDVIIACNTASVMKDQACDMVAKFITQQADDLDRGVSVYQNGSVEANNIRKLAAEIRNPDAPPDENGANAIKNHVHEIVTPTSMRAASIAANALIGTDGKPGQDEFLIVVDSTAGTCKSRQYIENISREVGRQLAADTKNYKSDYKEAQSDVPNPVLEINGKTDQGLFSPEQLGLPPGSSTTTQMDINMYEFTADDGSTKRLLITGRGDNAWVPAIEANILDNPVQTEQGDITVKQALARMARDDAGRFANENLVEANASRFTRQADLTMMCCTHFPAVLDALKRDMEENPGTTGDGDREPQFLTQDAVVRDMYVDLTDTRMASSATSSQSDAGPTIGVTNEMVELTTEEPTGPFTTKVRLGMAEMTEATRKDKTDVLNAVARNTPGVPGGDRKFEVGTVNDFPTFKAEHAAMEYTREKDKPFKEGTIRAEDSIAVEKRAPQDRDGIGQVFAKQPYGAFTDVKKGLGDVEGLAVWERNKKSSTPSERGSAVFRGFLKNPKEITGRLATNLNKTDDRIRHHLKDFIGTTHERDQAVQTLFRRLENLGAVMPQGEKRGVDILAATQEPGKELINASVTIADRILANRQKAFEEGAQLTPIGIVTGFTVIDAEGNSRGGENDGPPGAMAMAKFIIDQGTPVTLVIDSGSEAATFQTVKAMGMVEEDANAADTPIENTTFAGSRLSRNLSVEIVTHGPGTENAPNRTTVDDVRQRLTDSGTDLLISIERPGPSQDGSLSNMGARPIGQFNADLSPLFEGEHAWETVGIGDGGNEIGTGGVAQVTKTMRKPDFTQVVNKGDRVAAETRTHHMVLASVSNHGGLGVAMGAAAAVETLSAPIGNSRLKGTVDQVIDNYRNTIDTLYERGISTDGVTRVNAQSVDGRTLHRPAGQPAIPVGAPGATHDDMFELMKEAILSPYENVADNYEETLRRYLGGSPLGEME